MDPSVAAARAIVDRCLNETTEATMRLYSRMCIWQDVWSEDKSLLWMHVTQFLTQKQAMYIYTKSKSSNMARQSSLIPRTNATYIPRATTLQFHSHFLPRIRHRHLQISLGSVPVAVLFPSRRGPIMLHLTVASPNDTAINLPGNCFFFDSKSPGLEHWCSLVRQNRLEN